MPKVDQSQLLDIIAKLNAGSTDVEIGRSLKMPVSEVRKVIEEAVASGAYKKKMNHEERKQRRQEILDFIRSGDYTRQEVADKFGVSAALVEIVAREGGESRKAFKKKVGQLEILAGWINGERITDLSDRYKITRQAVNNAIDAASKAGVLEAINKLIKDGRKLPRA